MKLFVTSLSKKQLQEAPPPARLLFVQLGHLSNELSILQKWLYFCTPSPTSKLREAQSRARNAQALFATKLTAGKLLEAWEMTKKMYFGSKLAKEYDTLLSEKGQAALAQLKSYFSKGSLIYKIRNEFAFHYSIEQLTEVIDDLDDSDELEIYLSESVGNSFHFLSDFIVNMAMFKTILDDDEDKALENLFDKGPEKLFREVLDVAGYFLDFLGALTVVIASQHFGSDWKLEEEELPNTPAMDEVELPYFVERPKS